jgi:hypothetical protein
MLPEDPPPCLLSLFSSTDSRRRRDGRNVGTGRDPSVTRREEPQARLKVAVRRGSLVGVEEAPADSAVTATASGALVQVRRTQHSVLTRCIDWYMLHVVF